MHSAYRFPLRHESDALALSRFMHHALDTAPRAACAVLVDVDHSVMSDGRLRRCLSALIKVLAVQHIPMIVVAPDAQLRDRLSHASLPNSERVRFAASEGEAALFFLDSEPYLV